MTGIAEVLPGVASRVLEAMYFCNPVYVGPAIIAGPSIASVVGFKGPLSGTFQLSVTDRLARELTAVFLMTEPAEVSAAQSESTVAELGNVLCGAMMNALVPRAQIDFSVPRKLAVDEMLSPSPYCFSMNAGPPEVAVNIIL